MTDSRPALTRAIDSEASTETSAAAFTGGSFHTSENGGRLLLQDGFVWDAQDAYLFDIDGTLLRSTDRVHYDSFFSSVKQEMGRELLLDGVVVHGNTDPGILRDAFRIEKLGDAEWQPLLESVLDRMRRTVAAQRSAMSVRVMPGVEAVLAHLRAKGLALGVATGNLESIGWLKIEVAGLRDWFTFGGFSDKYVSRAEMIGNAAALARSLTSPRASVCVVGDTPFDITAARANSLPTIAVATGRYSFDELLEHRPEVCATTLDDLLRHTRGEYAA